MFHPDYTFVFLKFRILLYFKKKKKKKDGTSKTKRLCKMSRLQKP